MSRPRTGPLTRAWRLAHLTLHLAVGLTTAALWFPVASRAQRTARIRSWSAGVLRILRVRLTVRGDPPLHGRPVLLVANHVSWLDIFAIDAVIPVRFIAKAEVRRWPLAGWLAARSGTLFIERARRHDTARINDAVSRAFRDGDPVAVFPEGGATDGSAIMKFHGSLLQPALDTGAEIHPVAIAYARQDGSRSEEAAYDGDKSLWFTLKLIVGEPEIEARVTFLPALALNGSHRRDVAAAAQVAISQTLRLPAVGTRVGTADRPQAVSP